MPKPSERPVRHLWLLRHGKAASDAPWGGSDRERPLTAGAAATPPPSGDGLAKEQPVLGLEGVPRPELVHLLGRRADPPDGRPGRQGHGRPAPVDRYRSLYDADTDLVLQYVREIDEGVNSALVVGHNPTVYQLVWELVGGTDEDGGADRAALEAHGFPTCALAVLTLEVPPGRT